MKRRTRLIIGNFMIWTGLIGVLINSIYLAYFANPAILRALAQRSLICNVIFVLLMIIGGALGMRE